LAAIFSIVVSVVAFGNPLIKLVRRLKFQWAK